MKAIKFVWVTMCVMFCTLVTNAKDYTITLESSPEGAQVYVNEVMVTSSTPALVKLPKSTVTKAMMIKFVKEGYETKTMVVQYNKEQLKYSPVVHCDMKKSAPQAAYDPTITGNQSQQRVSRQNAGATDMEATIIRWFFDSDPRGSRIMYRVISNVPNEVKNTNETYLTTTPYEETRGFNIPGLTYQNSRNVTIEIKASKRGYEDQVKRFNVRQALDQQEISGFFELVEKESQAAPAPIPASSPEPETAPANQQTTVVVVSPER